MSIDFRTMGEKCRSCGAPVVWAHAPGQQRNVPLDREPRADGNIALKRDPAGLRQPSIRYLKKGERAEEGESLHVSHFATCPQAKQWRGR